MFIVVDDACSTCMLSNGVCIKRNSITHLAVVGQTTATVIRLTADASYDASFLGFMNAHCLRVHAGEALLIRDRPSGSDRLLQRLFNNDCTVSYLTSNSVCDLGHGDILILRQMNEALTIDDRIAAGLRAFVFVTEDLGSAVHTIHEHGIAASFWQRLSAFLGCVKCTVVGVGVQAELSRSENDERLRVARVEILAQGLHPRLGALSRISLLGSDNASKVAELL
jgi:hypothetical protein